MNEFEEHLQTRKNIQEKNGFSDTPFVVLYGTSNDLSCFVRIHDKNYKIVDGDDLSIVQAVDICFKAFHALRKDFTLASDCSWIFLESEVYKLTVSIKRKTYKNIPKLLTELSKLN